MSTTENTATEKRDVYERVTSQIVNAIEQGVSNWRMPWHTSGKFAFSPINVVTHKPYRGVNILALWAVARSKGYERGEWATYQQWQERRAQVRKGEKSASVAFWKFADGRTESQDGSEDTEQPTASRSRLLFCREYHVFNVAQVDGYTPKADADTPIEQRIEHAEEFFTGINTRVVHLVLLCYKKTIRCRIVLWAKRPRQAHRNNALRHISRAWRKPQGTLTGTSR